MRNLSLWLAKRPDSLIIMAMIFALAYLIKLPILVLLSLTLLAFYGYGVMIIYREGPSWIKTAMIEAERKGRKFFEIVGDLRPYILFKGLDKFFMLPIRKNYQIHILFLEGQRLAIYRVIYNALSGELEESHSTREIFYRDISSIDVIQGDLDKMAITLSNGQKIEIFYENKKVGGEAVRQLREYVRDVKSR